MFKLLTFLSTLLLSFTSSPLYASCSDSSCCQSVDCSIGWRHDDLNWKTKHLDSSYIPGHANSRIHFKDINSYTLSAKAKWADSSYYIRCSAEYGLTDKGRAKELFKISSPYLFHPIQVETNDPIKRRSEVYDFDAAVGYPFAFCCCRLSVVPLIGFSFHRQHIRVKEDKHSTCSHSSSFCSCPSGSGCESSSSDCTYCSYSESCDDSSSSSFLVSSSNPFNFSTSSDPFKKPSDPHIASALGLINSHRTDNYRFTWYGFYLGTDIAYALDSCWTLYSELELHFLDNCHRKRKSWTGVYFVDHYHKKGWAYGFNGEVGVTYSSANCWYTDLAVDFNWWKGDAKHDDLYWRKVGVKVGLGYMF